jgi:hypothetical protein
MLEFHYLPILAPNVGCDPSQGFLTKKNSISTHIRNAMDKLIFKDIKNSISSFQVRLVRSNKC